MNAKFALALILTLQVSMTLCEAHEPSQELVDTVAALRTKFLQRIEVAFARAWAAAESNEHTQALKGQVEALPNNPKYLAIKQVAEAIRKELEPLVEPTRNSVLGVYEAYFRTYLRQPLEAAIPYISNLLDQYMPLE